MPFANIWFWMIFFFFSSSLFPLFWRKKSIINHVSKKEEKRREIFSSLYTHLSLCGEIKQRKVCLFKLIHLESKWKTFTMQKFLLFTHVFDLFFFNWNGFYLCYIFVRSHPFIRHRCVVLGRFVCISYN